MSGGSAAVAPRRPRPAAAPRAGTAIGCARSPPREHDGFAGPQSSAARWCRASLGGPWTRRPLGGRCRKRRSGLRTDRRRGGRSLDLPDEPRLRTMCGRQSAPAAHEGTDEQAAGGGGSWRRRSRGPGTGIRAGAAPRRPGSAGAGARSGGFRGLREPEIRPYERVITKDAVTDTGVFTVHRIKDRLFYEIPKDKLGKEFLWVSQIAKTTLGVGYGGQALATASSSGSAAATASSCAACRTRWWRRAPVRSRGRCRPPTTTPSSWRSTSKPSAATRRR